MGFAHFGGCAAGMGNAGVKCHRHIVSHDQGAHQLLGFFADLPKAAGDVGAKRFFQRCLIDALPAADLSTIAARGPEANAMCLQQNHAEAALRKMQRRRKPGEPAADNADIRPDMPR